MKEKRVSRKMARKLCLVFLGLAGLGAILGGCGPNRPDGAQGIRLSDIPAIIVEKHEPTRVLPGQPFPVEVVVRNPGEERLVDVEVTLELPAELQVVRSEPPALGGLVWRFAELLPGDAVHILLEVEGPAGEFPNVVRVKASRPVSAEASGLVAISPIPGLTASLSDSPGVIPVGSTVTYTLRVVGQGYGAARGVSVSIKIPEGMAFEGAEAPVGYAVDGSVLAFEPFVLNAGQEAVIQFLLRAEKAGDMVVQALIGYEGFSHRLIVEEGTVVYGG